MGAWGTWIWGDRNIGGGAVFWGDWKNGDWALERQEKKTNGD